MARQVRKATGDMSRRLEHVRTRYCSASFSLAEFHRHLGGSDFVSYQTVQNYHFDRAASVKYLAAVAETFRVRLEWLATGDGSPSHWGTPGVEGDIDVDKREALDHLEFHFTDPEERAISAEQEARISATKFLGPLIDATEPIVVDAFTTALFDRRSFEEGSQPTTVAEYNAMALRPTLTLDRILAQTWEGALALLRQELGIEAVDLNIDQQTRFTNGMILAILALLPERDLPVAS